MMDGDLKQMHDLLMDSQLQLNRLGDTITRALALLPLDMQDEIDPDGKFRKAAYDKYLEEMRSQDTIMTGGMFLSDPDQYDTLDQYIRWTADDFKRNEELPIYHDRPDGEE